MDVAIAVDTTEGAGVVGRKKSWMVLVLGRLCAAGGAVVAAFASGIVVVSVDDDGASFLLVLMAAAPRLRDGALGNAGFESSIGGGVMRLMLQQKWEKGMKTDDTQKQIRTTTETGKRTEQKGRKPQSNPTISCIMNVHVRFLFKWHFYFHQHSDAMRTMRTMRTIRCRCVVSYIKPTQQKGTYYTPRVHKTKNKEIMPRFDWVHRLHVTPSSRLSIELRHRLMHELSCVRENRCTPESVYYMGPAPALDDTWWQEADTLAEVLHEAGFGMNRTAPWPSSEIRQRTLKWLEKLSPACMDQAASMVDKTPITQAVYDIVRHQANFLIAYMPVIDETTLETTYMLEAVALWPNPEFKGKPTRMTELKRRIMESREVAQSVSAPPLQDWHVRIHHENLIPGFTVGKPPPADLAAKCTQIARLPIPAAHSVATL